MIYETDVEVERSAETTDHIIKIGSTKKRLFHNEIAYFNIAQRMFFKASPNILKMSKYNLQQLLGIDVADHAPPGEILQVED